LTLESSQGFRVRSMTTSTNSFTIPAIPGAAIACDLTGAPDTPEERFAEYGRLFAHGLIARDRAGSAVVFTFGAKPGVGDWIADLVRREAACCPFLAHEVEDRGSEIVWTISTEAGPAAEAYLDELLALPERLDEGFTGLLNRLAERDVHVVVDGPSRLVIADSASNTCGRGASCC
jgi:hypothetical protein